VNTLVDMLRSVAGRYGPRTAIVDADRVITYAELERKIAVLAFQLNERGVRQGDRVALLFPNQLEFVSTFFSIVSLGAIAVPLNSHYQQNEITQVVQTCAASLLVTSPEYASLCEQSQRLLVKAGNLLIIDPGVEDDANASVLQDSGLNIDSDRPVMWQFSSGSTGKPKRIARTHAQLLMELDSLGQALKVTPEDRFLGVTPFSHVNGLMRSMMLSLHAGATLYPLAKFDRHWVAQTIERNRLTMWIGVPFMFATMAATPFRSEPDFSSLRLCLSASAPIPKRVCEQFYRRFGRHVRQLYGSTETGTLSINLSSDIEKSLESVGTPLAHVKIDLFDENGRGVAPGEIGEVAIQSPAAIRAYEGNDPAHARAFRNGYFFTGDLGRKADGGLLYLVGRKGFLINKAGYKINPREIEELLEADPRVEEAVVLGVPTSYGDEKVHALVVLRQPCTVESLMDHCRGKIADFKIPSVIEFTDALPRTATGKLERRALAQARSSRVTRSHSSAGS
jgi:long-chain acyl-CoA synthetase